MIELGELERNQAAFARRNTRVMVVSLESTEDAEQTKKQFPDLVVVADKDTSLAGAAQVIDKGAGPDGNDAAAPTTFLIDRRGVVRWRFRPDRFIERLSAQEVLDAVDKYLTAD